MTATHSQVHMLCGATAIARWPHERATATATAALPMHIMCLCSCCCCCNLPAAQSPNRRQPPAAVVAADPSTAAVGQSAYSCHLLLPKQPTALPLLLKRTTPVPQCRPVCRPHRPAAAAAADISLSASCCSSGCCCSFGCCCISNCCYSPGCCCCCCSSSNCCCCSSRSRSCCQLHSASPNTVVMQYMVLFSHRTVRLPSVVLSQ